VLARLVTIIFFPKAVVERRSSRIGGPRPY